MKKVILCDKCKGWGFVEISNRGCAYETEVKEEICNKCKGTGRLIIETTINEMPYRSDNLANKAMD
ncbi:hypothetical protein [Anaerovorax sp. IOR16]|uniref:hypothetical protein n=1 Tax=Anaerovorax sp. IOR16 TaxID=2773458 RepID=UPI0019D1491E|nr:hypothetical protein [Anaerovorax sp. IOR16]